jgi:hypothetical protein
MRHRNILKLEQHVTLLFRRKKKYLRCDGHRSVYSWDHSVMQ